jgi:hypothetical protein
MKRHCFAFVILAILFGPGPAHLHAQGIADCVWPEPIYLSRIVGQVVDSEGAVLPDALVTLRDSDRAVGTTRTDQAGAFTLKAPQGVYQLLVERQYFDTLHLEVHLGSDAYHLVRPSYLHVILAIHWLSCTWATTSDRKFKQEIENYKTEFPRSSETHATQK